MFSQLGTDFEPLGEAWAVTANTLTPLQFQIPETAIGKETIYVRIMGVGSELLSDKNTIDGRRAGAEQRGVTIVRSQDGTTRKVIK